MSNRFPSLDVFRGATVALMILVNNPGSWAHIYPPLAHAPWHGATPTDLVFPFFLFAVGNAMAFVLPRFEGAPASDFWGKVGSRAFLIFSIGLLLNWFPFVRYDADGELVAKAFGKLRILGVLQRIALCYFLAAAAIRLLGDRGAAYASVATLIAYWGVCLAFGQPGDPYSLEGWFGTPIDKALLGEDHLNRGEGVPFDPEGLMSTLPATVQVVIGYLAGRYIVRKGPRWEMLGNLFAVALLLIFAGFCWHLAFPINKKIWTSSYVLYTGGLAMATLGFAIWLIEFHGRTGAWCRFFQVFGRNPLFIFVLSGVVAKCYALFRISDVTSEGKPVVRGLGAWMYEHLFSPAFGPMNGSLLYAIAHIIVFWAVCHWLDRKKIYIRV
jgi:predicted acyltransferase